MGGTAKDFYEAGIRLALEENGVTDQNTINEYINRTEVKDVDYKDPLNEIHNIKGRVKVDVKWNDADSDELKLEKIITLFPVFLNNMPGVDTELQLRRIPLVETSNNTLEIASLVEALGGPNNGGTRVFWDVPTEQRGETSEDNDYQIVIPVNF